MYLTDWLNLFFFEPLALLLAPFQTTLFMLTLLIQGITGQCLVCCNGYCA